MKSMRSRSDIDVRSRSESVIEVNSNICRDGMGELVKTVEVEQLRRMMGDCKHGFD